MPCPKGRGTTHVVTLPIGGSTSSSSSSSSSNDRREFHELTRAVDEARQHYFDTTRDVVWLEHCLNAVRVALEASERETAAV
jgi:hypothetical protein